MDWGEVLTMMIPVIMDEGKERRDETKWPLRIFAFSRRKDARPEDRAHAEWEETGWAGWGGRKVSKVTITDGQ